MPLTSNIEFNFFSSNSSALMYASENGHLEVVKSLINSDVNLTNEYIETLIFTEMENQL